MEMPRSTTTGVRAGRNGFPSTHWATICAAGQGSTPDARAAFGELYEIYRPALLLFLRGQGHPPHQAEELLQGFFEALLARSALGTVDQRGRFRTWLLACLRHFVRDRWAYENAQIRRPAEPLVPVGESSESGYVQPQGRELSADRAFDRHYATAFLSRVMSLLAVEYADRGKEGTFEALLPFLQSKKADRPRAEVARQLGLTENTLDQEISRLRKRYRALFQSELERTCGAEDFEEEKRHLFAAVSA